MSNRKFLTREKQTPYIHQSKKNKTNSHDATAGAVGILTQTLYPPWGLNAKQPAPSLESTDFFFVP